MPDNKAPNFGYLLLGLCVLWMGLPLLRLLTGDDSQIIAYLIVGIALMIAARSVLQERLYFLIAVVLVVLSVASAIAAYSTENEIARLLVVAFQFIFWTAGSIVVARFVLTSGPVDVNRIFAGVCLYLMAGIIWAMVYSLFFQFYPDSLRGIDGLGFGEQLSNIFYFSFVTLTTLGYGDIVPVHPVLRAFVQVEAVFGQLYVAILIASLVGARITGQVKHAEKRNNSKGQS